MATSASARWTDHVAAASASAQDQKHHHHLSHDEDDDITDIVRRRLSVIAINNANTNYSIGFSSSPQKSAVNDAAKDASSSAVNDGIGFSPRNIGFSSSSTNPQRSAAKDAACCAVNDGVCFTSSSIVPQESHPQCFSPRSINPQRNNVNDAARSSVNNLNTNYSLGFSPRTTSPRKSRTANDANNINTHYSTIFSPRSISPRKSVAYDAISRTANDANNINTNYSTIFSPRSISPRKSVAYDAVSHTANDANNINANYTTVFSPRTISPRKSAAYETFSRTASDAACSAVNNFSIGFSSSIVPQTHTSKDAVSHAINDAPFGALNYGIGFSSSINTHANDAVCSPACNFVSDVVSDNIADASCSNNSNPVSNSKKSTFNALLYNRSLDRIKDLQKKYSKEAAAQYKPTSAAVSSHMEVMKRLQYKYGAAAVAAENNDADSKSNLLNKNSTFASIVQSRSKQSGFCTEMETQSKSYVVRSSMDYTSLHSKSKQRFGCSEDDKETLSSKNSVRYSIDFADILSRNRAFSGYDITEMQSDSVKHSNGCDEDDTAVEVKSDDSDIADVQSKTRGAVCSNAIDSDWKTRHSLYKKSSMYCDDLQYTISNGCTAIVQCKTSSVDDSSDEVTDCSTVASSEAAMQYNKITSDSCNDLQYKNSNLCTDIVQFKKISDWCNDVKSKSSNDCSEDVESENSDGFSEVVQYKFSDEAIDISSIQPNKQSNSNFDCNGDVTKQSNPNFACNGDANKPSIPNYGCNGDVTDQSNPKFGFIGDVTVQSNPKFDFNGDVTKLPNPNLGDVTVQSIPKFDFNGDLTKQPNPNFGCKDITTVQHKSSNDGNEITTVQYKIQQFEYKNSMQSYTKSNPNPNLNSNSTTTTTQYKHNNSMFLYENPSTTHPGSNNTSNTEQPKRRKKARAYITRTLVDEYDSGGLSTSYHSTSSSESSSSDHSSSSTFSCPASTKSNNNLDDDDADAVYRKAMARVRQQSAILKKECQYFQEFLERGASTGFGHRESLWLSQITGPENNTNSGTGVDGGGGTESGDYDDDGQYSVEDDLLLDELVAFGYGDGVETGTDNTMTQRIAYLGLSQKPTMLISNPERRKSRIYSC